MNKKEIDLELAKQILQNIVQDIDSEVGIDYIQKFVSEYFSVTVESLKAKTRKREIVRCPAGSYVFRQRIYHHVP